MGTRSITHVHEMDELGGNIVCSFFRSWDGYPSGHGKDLAEWLKGKNLVNGRTGREKHGRDFNRAGEMAVKLMNHIQEKSGCEVVPTGASDYGEEFTYDIYFRNGNFYLAVDGEHSFPEFRVDQYDGEKLENELIVDE